MEPATVEGATLIGRRVPHARPTGCTRLRDDGVQATKTWTQGKRAMPAALAQGEGVGKGAVQLRAR